MVKTIGHHIRIIRRSQNKTIKDVSELSGLSLPYISDIERDAVNPSFNSLQALAYALNMSLPQLVDYNDDLHNNLIAENKELRNRLDIIRDILP